MSAAYILNPRWDKMGLMCFNHLGGFIKKIHGISSMKKKDSEFIQDGYFQVIFRASLCPYLLTVGEQSSNISNSWDLKNQWDQLVIGHAKHDFFERNTGRDVVFVSGGVPKKL